MTYYLVASTYFSTNKEVSNSNQTTNLTNTEPEKVEKENTKYYNVGNIHLNRAARNVKLKPGVKLKYPGAHTGFLFNADDNNTQKWRPQGIVGMGKVNGRSILLVSWYGKGSYKNRGGRISICNVSDMGKVRYRHVLLVDKDLNTFPDCHVGGLAVVGNKLHVADSRGNKDNPLSDGSYDKILVFDMTKIEKIDTTVMKYPYVLRLESSYNVPINPGYISYNDADNELMIGTFTCGTGNNIPNNKCRKKFSTGPAQFVFGEPGSIDRNSTVTTLEYLENELNKEFRLFQGMSTFTYEGKKYLITASSFNIRPSSFSLFEEKDGKWEWVANKNGIAQGLEDVFISSKNVWSLTEFSPKELGDRAVMAWRTSKIVSEAKAAQKQRGN